MVYQRIKDLCETQSGPLDDALKPKLNGGECPDARDATLFSSSACIHWTQQQQLPYSSECNTHTYTTTYSRTIQLKHMWFGVLFKRVCVCVDVWSQVWYLIGSLCRCERIEGNTGECNLSYRTVNKFKYNCLKIYWIIMIYHLQSIVKTVYNVRFRDWSQWKLQRKKPKALQTRTLQHVFYGQTIRFCGQMNLNTALTIGIS